jgi:hypothetical protein
MPTNYTDEARLAYLRGLASEDAADQEWLRTIRDYADGRHPAYLTDRQKEFLGLRTRTYDYLYAHNLCRLVIQAVVERLAVTGFSVVSSDDAAPDDAFAHLAQAWWEGNRMDAGQDGLYESAVRDGAAYVIVDWDGERPRWTVNYQFDGTQGVKVHRDPDTGAILYATKRWQTYDPARPGQTGRTRLTMYFPDRVEKYVATSSKDAAFAQAGWDVIRDGDSEPWPIPWVDGAGPLGLPVIPFENPGGSEIADLMPLQDMLNKSDLDLIAGEDAAGFRILWASGMDAEIDPSTGEERSIAIGPGRLVRMSDPDARLGAIEPVDPTKMIAASKYWIESAAGVTRTPQYLFQAQGADQPSGESLKMQEVGLLAKVGRRQRVFGNAWEDVVYLSARLWNLYRPGETTTAPRVQALWKDAATRDEKAFLEGLLIRQQLGVPEAQVWREAGYDEETIAAMEAEKERGSDQIGEQLLTAFDRGQ